MEVPVNLGLVLRRPFLSIWHLSGTGPGTKLSMTWFLPLKIVISPKNLSESWWGERRQGERLSSDAGRVLHPIAGGSYRWETAQVLPKSPSFRHSVLLSGITADLCFRKDPYSKRNGNQHLLSIYYVPNIILVTLHI